MHILHLIPSLSTGGAERQLSYLAAEQARMGYKVSVGYIYEGPGPLVKLDENISFHPIRIRNHYNPAIISRIINLIKENRPHIVQTWLLLMDVIGGAASRLTKTPWVLRESSSSPGYTLNNWKQRLRVYMGTFSSAIVANSPGGALYWRSKGIENGIRIVPNGVPLDLISAAPQAQPENQELSTGKTYIIFTGRLVEGKNIQNLIQALSLVPHRKQVNAVICGEGYLRGDLDKKIRDSGLSDRIQMPGYLSKANLFSLIKGASAFTFLSNHEGMPNAVLEAMACRCPLIVSDIPAHRAFLNDSMAIFVDHKSPEAIAKAIIDVVETRDVTRIQRAWNRAGEFTIPKMAASYEQVYTDILARENGSSRKKANT